MSIFSAKFCLDFSWLNSWFSNLFSQLFLVLNLNDCSPLDRIFVLTQNPSKWSVKCIVPCELLAENLFLQCLQHAFSSPVPSPSNLNSFHNQEVCFFTFSCCRKIWRVYLTNLLSICLCKWSWWGGHGGRRADDETDGGASGEGVGSESIAGVRVPTVLDSLAPFIWKHSGNSKDNLRL